MRRTFLLAAAALASAPWVVSRAASPQKRPAARPRPPAPAPRPALPPGPPPAPALTGQALLNTLPAPVLAALERAGTDASALGVMLLPLDSPAGAPPSPLRPTLAWQAQQAFNPASLFKLVTTFAGLDLLGPAFSWRTPVYWQGSLNNGVLEGTLYLRGSGDPALVHERLWLLLRRLRQMGLREIRGDIVLDRSAFAPPDIGAAEFDGDPTRPYNVRPDALLLNHKSYTLSFVAEPGQRQARVLMEPPLAGVELPASVPVAEGHAPCEELRTALQPRLDDPNRLRFEGALPGGCAWPTATAAPGTGPSGSGSGSASAAPGTTASPSTSAPATAGMPAGLAALLRPESAAPTSPAPATPPSTAPGPGRATAPAAFGQPTGAASVPGVAGAAPTAANAPRQPPMLYLAYADPASHAGRLITALWRELGGELRGQVREGPVPAGLVPVAESVSPPLAQVVRDINKYSNNVMAEQLLLTLAAQADPSRPATLAEARALLRRWAASRMGAASLEGLVFDNGSGLSRSARLSPQWLALMLVQAWRSPVMAELMGSLPIGGVDGTLRRSQASVGRAHLKTGTLRDAAGVAGYVLDARGRHHVLVAMLAHSQPLSPRPVFDALVDWLIHDAPAAP